MKKTSIHLFYVTIVSLLVILTAQCTSDKSRLHKELTDRALKLNQSTPVALEQHTRFDSAGVTDENVFQYYYTLTNIDNPNELISRHKNDLEKNIDKMYATNKSLQFFVQNEITMEYIYRDTLQNVIEVITIETDKYKK